MVTFDLLLACGHTVPATRNHYLSGNNMPPMEWCHHCRHARFIRRFV